MQTPAGTFIAGTLRFSACFPFFAPIPGPLEASASCLNLVLSTKTCRHLYYLGQHMPQSSLTLHWRVANQAQIRRHLPGVSPASTVPNHLLTCAVAVHSDIVSSWKFESSFQPIEGSALGSTPSCVFPDAQNDFGVARCPDTSICLGASQQPCYKEWFSTVIMHRTVTAEFLVAQACTWNLPLPDHVSLVRRRSPKPQMLGNATA